MVKKYGQYLKESKHDEILNVINSLVKSGDITLNTISSEKFAKLLYKKSKKYPRFGFESLMMNLADDSREDFISAGDYQRMGDYIDKIKELDIDASKLEKLYPMYKKYWDMVYGEYDKKEKDLDKLYKEFDKLNNYVDDFIAELKRISKLVVEKL